MKNEKQINSLIGGKIILIRDQKNIPRSKLAVLLNISHQQLKKYETGENRISAGKLAVLCNKLKINPLFFFSNSCINNEILGEVKKDLNLLIAYFIQINQKSKREAILNVVKELINTD